MNREGLSARAGGRGVTAVGVVCGLLCLAAAAAEVPPAVVPPGGLAPANTPQIVLLSFDDSVTTASYALVSQVLTNRYNPNGDAIKATFFVSLDGLYDPVSIRRLYEAGHEIAVHTMSHDTDTNSTLPRWRQEIAGERRTLAALCAIPAAEIVGFRAPYLKVNDAALRTLHERGLLYDASYAEDLSLLSASPSELLWPYTLDQGLAQAAPPERAPATNYPGLFEIPLWPQFSNTTVVTLMDPPESFSSNAVVALWKTNFLARYHGNRAPFPLALHATAASQWLSHPTHSAWRVGALKEFLGWALAQPDTWAITYRDLVDFMLAPTNAGAAAQSAPFLTTAHTPFPTGSIVRCSFPDSHALYVCGPCPPAAPSYSNAYLGTVSQAGATVTLNVISQSATRAWCVMIVSNGAPRRLYGWSVGFGMTGGTLEEMYDAQRYQTNLQVFATAKHYNKQLAPGAALALPFSVKDFPGVTFHDAWIAATGLGPQEIGLTLETPSAPARVELTWDDNAHVYRVERTASLMPPAWSVVTNEIGLPRFSEPRGDGTSRFYRVVGTLY